MHVVTEVIPAGQPTIVFASTRHHVELLAQLMRADGVASAHVYGTMDQARHCSSVSWSLRGRKAVLLHDRWRSNLADVSAPVHKGDHISRRWLQNLLASSSFQLET